MTGADLPHARLRGPFLAACLALAVGAPAWPAAAQGAHVWRPDDRILISAFDEIGAVATDIRRVFAASPNGIQVYDFAADRWRAPITAEDGYPVGARPSALAYDAFGDRLWLGTEHGELHAYDVSFGRWRRYGPVAGRAVDRIVADAGRGDAVGGVGGVGDAILFSAGGRWFRLRRGSAAAEAVAPGRLPPGLDAGRETAERRLAREDPAFASVRDATLMDEHLRRWPVVDVAAGRLPHRFWVGTRGGNLFLYDGRRAAADPMRYGLVSAGVSALASDDDGIWFGGDGRGPRAGVAHADRPLQRWRRFEAGIDDAPRGEVRAIEPTTGAVWFAAGDGVYRYDRARDGWTRLTEGDGLPTTDATALAAVPAGVWVGTARGLAFVSDAGTVDRRIRMPGRRIRNLAAAHDTLWIAGPAGIRWLPARPTAGGAGARAAPAGATGRPAALDRDVVDVRPAFGSLWALTGDALYRFDGARWHGPMREPTGAGLGRLRALAVGRERVWIAGDGGAAGWNPAARLWTFFRVGPDIPEGPVRMVLPTDDAVWLATPLGALRLEPRR